MPKTKTTNILIEKSIFTRLEIQKTNTFIEKSIFNKPETKRNQYFHWTPFSIGHNKYFHWNINSGLKNIVNSNKERHSTVFHNGWDQNNKKISLKNPFSIGMRPKKQKLSLKKQVSIGLRPKKQTLSLKNTFSIGLKLKKTKTLIEKSIFNRPETPKKNRGARACAKCT